MAYYKTSPSNLGNLIIHRSYSRGEVLKLLGPIRSDPGSLEKANSFVEKLGKKNIPGQKVYDFYKEMEWIKLYHMASITSMPYRGIRRFLEKNTKYGLRVHDGIQGFIICSQDVKKKFGSGKLPANSTAEISRNLDKICDDTFIDIKKFKEIESKKFSYSLIEQVLNRFGLAFDKRFVPSRFVKLKKEDGKRICLFNRDCYNILVKGFYGHSIIDKYSKPTKRFELSDLFSEASSYVQPKTRYKLTHKEEIRLSNKFLTVAHELRNLESKIGLSSLEMRKIAGFMGNGHYTYITTEEGSFSKAYFNKMFYKMDKLDNLAKHFIGIFAWHNYGLVVKMARNYFKKNKSLTFNDLISEGMLGLIMAVKKFDPSKGYKFSTYANWWIRQSILRAIADKGYMVGRPIYVNDALKKVYYESNKFFKKNNYYPDEYELSKELGLSVEQTKRMLEVKNMGDVESLNEKRYEEGNEEDITIVVDEKASQFEDESILNVDGLKLRAMLSDTLNERELDIVKKRFALDENDKHEYTLEEVANKYELTRERIRQIEEKALDKLKKNPKFVEAFSY